MKNKLEKCPKCKKKLSIAKAIGPYCSNKKCDVIDNISQITNDQKFEITTKKEKEAARYLKNFCQSHNDNCRTINDNKRCEFYLMAGISNICRINNPKCWMIT